MHSSHVNVYLAIIIFRVEGSHFVCSISYCNTVVFSDDFQLNIRLSLQTIFIVHKTEKTRKEKKLFPVDIIYVSSLKVKIKT